METQDHNLPKQPGHEGQVHVCHKCGWPFPKPHPSAKHRRAHKKVCGKLEGYMLNDDVADKTQVMNDSDAEHAPDGEGKTPSGKDVESNTSQKSCGGVLTRSSRSTRSEEELFADAATDFTDGSGSCDASEAVMQRFYSIQHDFDDTIDTAEHASAGTTCVPNIIFDHQDQVQTVPEFTSENATVEVDPVERIMGNFPKTLNEQDIVANECKETLDNVPGLRASDEEIQGLIPESKSTGMECTSSNNKTEHLHAIDALGNFSSIDHSSDVKDATKESTNKLSDAMEDHGLKADSRDNIHGLIIKNPDVGISEEISSKDDIKTVNGVEGKLKHDVKSEGGTNSMPESFENEKVSSSVQEQKPIVSLENVLPEGDISVKYSTQHVLPEWNSEIIGKELSRSLVLGEELGNINESTDLYNDGGTRDVQTHLEGNERNESKDTTPDCASSIADSHDIIEKSLEPQITCRHGESDVTRDIRDVMVGFSVPLAEGTGTSSREGDNIGEDGQGVLKSDHLASLMSNTIQGEALEDHKDAPCSLKSSAVLSTCTHKFAEENPSVVENDRNDTIKQHHDVSAIDVLDSSSQADSLEGNWGSVSVMSTLSDTTLAAEAHTSIQSLPSPAEQNVSLDPKSVETRESDSQTSVDPNVGVSKTEGISEIQTLETAWPSSSTSHVEDVSLGGKRDNEIIAKVTNWSIEKNHAPLKTLLGEATARSREESPVHYTHSSTSMPLKDEIPGKNSICETEKGTHSSNDPGMDASKDEMGKEWHSPARYPVNIKTEKKRGKIRSSWMPFFCCSSVNARYDRY